MKGISMLLFAGALTFAGATFAGSGCYHATDVVAQSTPVPEATGADRVIGNADAARIAPKWLALLKQQGSATNVAMDAVVVHN